MPSLQAVLEFSDQMWASARSIIEKKGADYNRDQQNTGNTLFNLEVCEILGIVPSTEEGILVRLSDKFMRLISLTKPGREAAVKDESVLDTIRDMQNYLNYLGMIWLERRNKLSSEVVSGHSPTLSAALPTSSSITSNSKTPSSLPTGATSVRDADLMTREHSSLTTLPGTAPSRPRS